MKECLNSLLKIIAPALKIEIARRLYTSINISCSQGRLCEYQSCFSFKGKSEDYTLLRTFPTLEEDDAIKYLDSAL